MASRVVHGKKMVIEVEPTTRLGKTKPAKLVAVLSGGDWADAAADHLVIPADLDIEAARIEWNKWYRETYCPSLATKDPIRCCPTLAEWLIEHHGARFPTDDEICVFDNT